MGGQRATKAGEAQRGGSGHCRVAVTAASGGGATERAANGNGRTGNGQRSLAVNGLVRPAAENCYGRAGGPTNTTITVQRTDRIPVALSNRP